MKLKTLTRLTAAVIGLSALAACGNGTNDTRQLLRQLPGLLANKDAAPQRVSQEQLAQALTQTTAPIMLIQVENTDAQFLMLEIERNRAYQSFGTSTRQVINFRDGMITSTRGLGGDLMSSEEDALLAAVRNRGGSATYVMRFLTPEDLTTTKTYQCSVSGGGAVPVANTSGTQVTASCTGEGQTFTNTYVVGAGGYILSVRQYLGETLNYIGAQTIRR